MNAFLIDLTHGGVKISTQLAKSKSYEKVFAYDLYNTLKEEDENLLSAYNVVILKDLDELKEEICKNSISISKRDTDEKDLIINPIHSSLKIENMLSEIGQNKDLKDIDIKEHYKVINHHDATKLILNEWKEKCVKQNIKIIEITGVKGKTSTVYLLKEIFSEDNKNTLLLSSLGARLFRNNAENGIILQKNISITPANIISTIQLAKKIVNPKCRDYPKDNDSQKDSYDLNYEIAIFENSLGICGFGDIGILTNLVENYPIAKGQSNACEAKKQVFKAPTVIIEYETLETFYKEESEVYKDKINSFSIDDRNANVYCKNIDFNIENTKIEIVYHNLKTISGNKINGSFALDSFALGKHHVLNILTAVTTALALEIDEDSIKKGISNFKGIEGRTQLKNIENSLIIEEINPGINTKAIESSINMIRNINDYYIIIGGKYGVTCEEIDEEKLSSFLDDYLGKNPKTKLILCDELGESIYKQLKIAKDDKYEIQVIANYEDALDIAVKNKKNALFIYRSNYSQISKR